MHSYHRQSTIEKTSDLALKVLKHVSDLHTDTKATQVAF